MNKNRGIFVLVLLVMFADEGAAQTNQGSAAEEPPKVPFNEIFVMWPVDGEVLEFEDLDVDIASGYGVLTFISITLNEEKVIEVATIDAGKMGTLTVVKGELKIGENVLQVNSWHQLPGREDRLAKFTAPLITFTVKNPGT